MKEILLGSVAPQEKEFMKSGIRETGQRLIEKNALAKLKLKRNFRKTTSRQESERQQNSGEYCEAQF